MYGSESEFRRLQLGKFLRSKRANISANQDPSLVRVGRRRTLGLRREDVASLAGVGLTWYTWLEQGRDIKVSTAFLDQLSKALLLNDAERNYLFTMAHQQPPPIEQRDSRIRPVAALQTMLDCINQPAYVRNPYFDVIAWNDVNTRFFGDFGKIPKNDRNIIWLMFTKEKYRSLMPEWEKDCRKLVANLRLGLAEAHDRKGFQLLIDRLYRESDKFRNFWSQHEVDNISEGVSHIKSSKLGDILFDHFTLTPDGIGDERIVIFVDRKNKSGL